MKLWILLQQKKQQNTQTYSSPIKTSLEVIKIQGEYHLPGHNFTGPGTQLKYRLERGDEPINKVDSLSLHHDLRYEFYGDDGFEVFRADVQFIGGAIGITLSPTSTFRERSEALLVGSIMTLKVVSDVALPSKRVISLAQKLKKLRKISAGISVIA